MSFRNKKLRERRSKCEARPTHQAVEEVSQLVVAQRAHLVIEVKSLVPQLRAPAGPRRPGGSARRRGVLGRVLKRRGAGGQGRHVLFECPGEVALPPVVVGVRAAEEIDAADAESKKKAKKNAQGQNRVPFFVVKRCVEGQGKM